MSIAKNLPEYFCIKQDLSNPLWRKYIDWLNKTYKKDFVGVADTQIYYGVYEKNGCSNFNNPNNVPVLTLKEWDSIVNKPFTLPEKWCILRTKDNHKIINEWFIRPENNKKGYFYEHKEYYLTSDYINCDNWVNPSSGKPDGYTEITFDQFLEHVVNKNKKYTIDEVKNNKNIVVYLDNEQEWNELNELIGFKVVDEYRGQYCYNCVKKTYSKDSTRKDPGAYTDATIITINDIIKPKQKNMNQKLTIKQLKELFSVSNCGEWENVIRGYLIENFLLSDNDSVIIKDSHIQELLKRGTEKQKEAAKKYGIVLSDPIDYDRIRTGSIVKLKRTGNYCEGQIIHDMPATVIFWKTPHLISLEKNFIKKSNYPYYSTFLQNGNFILFSSHNEIDFITEVIEY